jgi:hypothetical protein
MIQLKDEYIKYLDEIGSLLNGMDIRGSQNIFIMSNVFSRLQAIYQEIERQRTAGIVIDNTSKEEKK